MPYLSLSGGKVQMEYIGVYRSISGDGKELRDHLDACGSYPLKRRKMQ